MPTAEEFPKSLAVPQACRDAKCTIEIVGADEGGINVQHNRTSTTFAGAVDGEETPSLVEAWLTQEHEVERATADHAAQQAAGDEGEKE